MVTALLLIAVLPLAAQPDRFGLPACSAPHQEIAERTAFTLCFDSSVKVARWSAYELKPEHLQSPAAPRPSRFRRDPLLPSPSDSDYRNSGYSRGHLVPAADLAWNTLALRDSFLLSNAIPQNQSLNAGKWRSLERAVRTLATSADAVIVLSGPIFCETVEHIGANQVAVPCELFKVVLAIHHDELTMFAAILPNTGNPNAPLAAFFTSVDEVQRRTGLDFFAALPASLQARLESTVSSIPR